MRDREDATTEAGVRVREIRRRYTVGFQGGGREHAPKNAGSV